MNVPLNHFSQTDVLPLLTMLTKHEKINWVLATDISPSCYIAVHNGTSLELDLNDKILHINGKYKFYDALELSMAIVGFPTDDSNAEFYDTVQNLFKDSKKVASGSGWRYEI